MTSMAPKRRFTDHKKLGRPLTLDTDHPAVVRGRTMFPSRVSEANERLLKSGTHQRKLGSHVVKGRWAGMPIFTLTLEERATCPRSCRHWRDCYGNHMHFPKRYKHGTRLENRLDVELQWLSIQHPDGFVVRLHILGDFYSSEYVKRWYGWMEMFPMLRVFGYTARYPRQDDDIGHELVKMRLAFGDRWWVRWSDRDEETWLATGDKGIVCPVQTGKTACCGTCALCWTVEKSIRFLVH
jgi:hypothetical protein